EGHAGGVAPRPVVRGGGQALRAECGLDDAQAVAAPPHRFLPVEGDVAVAVLRPKVDAARPTTLAVGGRGAWLFFFHGPLPGRGGASVASSPPSAISSATRQRGHKPRWRSTPARGGASVLFEQAALEHVRPQVGVGGDREPLPSLVAGADGAGDRVLAQPLVVD